MHKLDMKAHCVLNAHHITASHICIYTRACISRHRRFTNSQNIHAFFYTCACSTRTNPSTPLQKKKPQRYSEQQARLVRELHPNVEQAEARFNTEEESPVRGEEPVGEVERAVEGGEVRHEETEEGRAPEVAAAPAEVVAPAEHEETPEAA